MRLDSEKYALIPLNVYRLDDFYKREIIILQQNFAVEVQTAE